MSAIRFKLSCTWNDSGMKSAAKFLKTGQIYFLCFSRLNVADHTRRWYDFVYNHYTHYYSWEAPLYEQNAVAESFSDASEITLRANM